MPRFCRSSLGSSQPAAAPQRELLLVILGLAHIWPMTRAMVRDLWRCTSASFDAIAAIARKQTIPHLIQRFDVLCIPPQCGDHGEYVRLPAAINLRAKTQCDSGDGDRWAARDSRAVPFT